MLEEQIYVKDLRIFRNVDLKDIIIIDNSVLSFIFHMDNGIPILPFYDNKKDIELTFLVEYLKQLSRYENLGEQNRKFIPLDFFKRKANNELLDGEEDYKEEDQGYQEDDEKSIAYNHDDEESHDIAKKVDNKSNNIVNIKIEEETKVELNTNKLKDNSKCI